jgi:hypothetical protein
MEACNIVRMRVRPEFEAEFLAELDNPCRDFETGLCHAFLLQTGERTYCLVAQWDSTAALEDGEAQILRSLDQMRHMLEDLDAHGAVGPFSGRVVARHRFPVTEGEYWSG